jgi:hypothetical protein
MDAEGYPLFDMLPAPSRSHPRVRSVAVTSTTGGSDDGTEVPQGEEAR